MDFLRKGVKPSIAENLRHVGGSDYRFTDETVEGFLDALKTGRELPKISKWEEGPSALLGAMNGDIDSSLTFNRFWGATSPQTDVLSNTQESAAVQLRRLLKGDTPFTVKEAQKMRPRKITMAPSKVPNINNALAGRRLSGEKVEGMSQFMIGKERVPIDIHTGRKMGMPKGMDLMSQMPGLRALMKQSEGISPTTKLSTEEIYKRVEAAFRAGFDPLLGASDNFHGGFGRFWEGSRAQQGLKHQGGPIDILDANGLLTEGALKDPDLIRRVLKRNKWVTPALAAAILGGGAAAARAQGEQAQ